MARAALSGRTILMTGSTSALTSALGSVSLRSALVQCITESPRRRNYQLEFSGAD